MPGYTQEALIKFNHPPPKCPVDSPHPYKSTKKHGLPMVNAPDTTAQLPKNNIKRLQQIVGTFLFYSCAVDPTMLTSLSSITTEQTEGTETTKNKATHFLDYATTHPDAAIKYYPSDMILKIHSDASYLSE